MNGLNGRDAYLNGQHHNPEPASIHPRSWGAEPAVCAVEVLDAGTNSWRRARVHLEPAPDGVIARWDIVRDGLEDCSTILVDAVTGEAACVPTFASEVIRHERFDARIREILDAGRLKSSVCSPAAGAVAFDTAEDAIRCAEEIRNLWRAALSRNGFELRENEPCRSARS
jgi:hypothetical protein